MHREIKPVAARFPTLAAFGRYLALGFRPRQR
jgi:hypothetical protein